MRTATGAAGQTLPGAVPSRAFGRDLRLVASRDFARVFDGGRKRAGRLLVLWVAVGPADVRLGVVASKRTFRRAVDRARAKRLLREVFRLNRDRLVEGHDLVCVARRAMLGCGRREVEAEFVALARRGGIRVD